MWGVNLYPLLPISYMVKYIKETKVWIMLLCLKVCVNSPYNKEEKLISPNRSLDPVVSLIRDVSLFVSVSVSNLNLILFKAG